MIRKLTLACAVIGLCLGVAQADHHMEGDPPMRPEVILGPPEDFHPPEDAPPPEMPDDPDAAMEMMVQHFFDFMDADGSGALDLDEFQAWVQGVHMPPPDMMDDGMMHDDDGMMHDDDGMMHDDDGMEHDDDGMMHDDDGMMHDDDSGMMDGILRAGEGDLADLNIAPECSDDLRDSEQEPQATNHPCGDLEGNLLFRTICNTPGFDMAAISLPVDRGVGCFGIEALRGEIGFEIVGEDGTHAFDTTMGKDAYMNLKIDGPGVYEIKPTGGSPDGSITLRFVDVHTGL